MPRRPSGWYLGENFHAEVAMGPPCLFKRHSHSARDHRSLRYTDTQACVHCVDELTRPTLNLDVNAILRPYQIHYLEFWALVDVRGPDDCWEHQNRVLDHGRASWSKTVRHPSWLRNGQTRIAPYRVASWFAWGDTGSLEVKPVCGNKACCNPLHLRVQHVPHFHHAARIDRVDLCLQIERHQGHIARLLQERRQGPPEQRELFRRISPAWIDRIMAAVE
jgi:hypothetical protein